MTVGPQPPDAPQGQADQGESLSPTEKLAQALADKLDPAQFQPVGGESYVQPLVAEDGTEIELETRGHAPTTPDGQTISYGYPPSWRIELQPKKQFAVDSSGNASKPTTEAGAFKVEGTEVTRISRGGNIWGGYRVHEQAPIAVVEWLTRKLQGASKSGDVSTKQPPEFDSRRRQTQPKGRQQKRPRLLIGGKVIYPYPGRPIEHELRTGKNWPIHPDRSDTSSDSSEDLH